MKKIFLIYLLLCSSLSASISLNKQYIMFDQNKRNDNVTLFNASAETKMYKVSLVNYVQTHNEGYKKATPEEEEQLKFAKDVLLISPRRITLKPKETQVIRIQKKNISSIEDGEYISHLLIEEEDLGIEIPEQNTQTLSFVLKPLFAVSFPLVVRKGELELNKVDLQDPQLVFDEQAGKYVLSIDIAREGNKSTRGNLLIKVGDKEMHSVKGINVFLSTDKRRITMELPEELQEEIDKMKGKKTQPLVLEYKDEAEGLQKTLELFI